jgi:hypothetical protein
MDRWKASPRASREDEDKLWARFRAAQDTFFAARNALNAERDADETANLQAKEALVQQAEGLLPVQDAAEARRGLRDILAQWEAIGYVPRNARPVLEAKLKRVEDAVAAAERKRWQRTDPALRSRAEQTVAGFEASLAKLQAALSTALETGNQAKVRSLEASVATTQSLLEAAKRVLAEYESA